MESRQCAGVGAQRGEENEKMTLNMFGRPIESVFALAGQDENAATHAVGWTLGHSPLLVRELLNACGIGSTAEVICLLLRGQF